MASIDTSPSAQGISVRGMIAALADIFGRVEADAPFEDCPPEDLAGDLLRDNLDAFCSEADVQCMMSVYPGRF